MSSSSSSSSSSALPTVTILKEVQENYSIGRDVGYRVRLSITASDGITDSVFRYYQAPISAATGTAESVYDGVCTWSELSDIPDEEPNPTTSPQDFRLNYVDMVFQGVTEADQMIDYIMAELQILLNTVQRGQTLVIDSSTTLTATT